MMKVIKYEVVICCDKNRVNVSPKLIYLYQKNIDILLEWNPIKITIYSVHAIISFRINVHFLSGQQTKQNITVSKTSWYSDSCSACSSLFLCASIVPHCVWIAILIGCWTCTIDSAWHVIFVAVTTLSAACYPIWFAATVYDINETLGSGKTSINAGWRNTAPAPPNQTVWYPPLEVLADQLPSTASFEDLICEQGDIGSRLWGVMPWCAYAFPSSMSKSCNAPHSSWFLVVDHTRLWRTFDLFPYGLNAWHPLHPAPGTSQENPLPEEYAVHWFYPH